MTDAADLLRRHQPCLYYDSQEAYFADSAAEWTDNAGNVLTDGTGLGANVIATAGGTPPLSLDFLGANKYGDGTEVGSDDTVSDPTRDYLQQAHALHMRPEYANRIYGRMAEDSSGNRWLQYWRWHFYNDYAVAGFGLHEGDWEMTQYRLGDDDQPDLAVYAQHREAQQREWARVERASDDDARPVVYVARGSHASYFSAGTHWTGVWFDHANGRRRAAQGETLEILDDPLPGWVEWPGFWGDTRPLAPDDPLDQPSPRGPSQHVQWADPAALVHRAVEHALRPQAPPPPVPPAPTALVATRVDDRLRVSYHVAPPRPDQAAPAKIVVTINSRDDRLPPATYAFPVTGAALSGVGDSVILPRAIAPNQHYDVNVSAVSARGTATTATELDIGPVEARAAGGGDVTHAG